MRDLKFTKDHVYAEFEEPENTENIKSGEPLGVVFGKIAKWISESKEWQADITDIPCQWWVDDEGTKQGFTAGNENTASGQFSVAIGSYNTASHLYSVAIGYNNTASDEYTVAIGYIDISTVKADIEHLQTDKADKSDVYTKTETDNKIIAKVSEIVADAPEDFDTLKEMSNWIASHENSAAEMNSAIQTNKSNIEENTNNISALNTGVYLYNYPTTTDIEFSEGYVMRIGNQIHINCKLTFKNNYQSWFAIFGLPFKAKSPNSDGSRYTIKNIQSDGRETSIYMDNGKQSFSTSTTFLAGDIIEIKGLILDMYIEQLSALEGT